MYTDKKHRRKSRHHNSNPFLNHLFNDVFNLNINDFVGADWAQTNPAVNIFELNDGYVMEVAAPGLAKEDFTVNIEKNMISISAEKATPETDKKVKRREFNFSSFKRKFTLPETVNTQAITAKHENGVLSLTLPKKEEAKDASPRTVEIL